MIDLDMFKSAWYLWVPSWRYNCNDDAKKDKAFEQLCGLIEGLDEPVKYKLAIQMLCFHSAYIAKHTSGNMYNNHHHVFGGIINYFSGSLLIALFTNLMDKWDYYAQTINTTCNQEAIKTKVLPPLRARLYAQDTPDRLVEAVDTLDSAIFKPGTPYVKGTFARARARDKEMAVDDQVVTDLVQKLTKENLDAHFRVPYSRETWGSYIWQKDASKHIAELVALAKANYANRAVISRIMEDAKGGTKVQISHQGAIKAALHIPGDRYYWSEWEYVKEGGSVYNALLGLLSAPPQAPPQ